MAAVMDERKRRVLMAIIQDYIATAEPVGSRTIARRYLSQISAATIRNEMADLEEMGLLEQPYTSSGRIPSDKGYRYYVDHLLHDSEGAKEEINRLRLQFASGMMAMEEIVQETNQLLSSLTNYISLISGPNPEQSAFYRLQLVEMGSGQAVAVLISDNGHIANRVIQVPKGVDQKWLNYVSEFLSERLAGRSLQQLATDGLVNLRRELAGHLREFEQIFDLMLETLRETAFNKIYLGGKTQILTLPEFQDLERMRSLLALMEADRQLQQLLIRTAESDSEVHIRIGAENSVQEVEKLSLVSAPYKVHGRAMGYLGVLGPTRMDYSRVVTIVREVSDLLSEVLERD